MYIQQLTCPSFGKVLYGIYNQNLSKTQKDVLDDIELKIEENGYEKKLENLGYDIYLEPSDNNFSIDVAFFKNLRKNKNNKLVFDKVVNIGKFVSDVGLKFKQIPYSCSVEQLENCFNRFFKNEAWGKYKRNVNYL